MYCFTNKSTKATFGNKWKAHYTNDINNDGNDNNNNNTNKNINITIKCTNNSGNTTNNSNKCMGAEKSGERRSRNQRTHNLSVKKLTAMDEDVKQYDGKLEMKQAKLMTERESSQATKIKR